MSLEDLAQRFATLEQRLAEEEKRTKTLAETNQKLAEELQAATGANAPRAPLYIQRERKLPVFTGPPSGPNGLEIEEWVLDMRAHLAMRRDLTEARKAALVLEQLEGQPRREMRHRNDVSEEAENVFKVLLDLFSSAGVGATVAGLKEKFFTRRQGSAETVIDFSHALLKLQSQVLARDQSRPLVDAELMERFALGVRDRQLSRDLLRFMESHPSLSYIDLRDKALQWSGGEATVVRAAVAEEKVQVSQELLATITQQIRKELQLASGIPKVTPGKKGQLRCFKCGGTGHFRRDCPMKKESQPEVASLGPPKVEN